jgi:hypothetical protein
MTGVKVKLGKGFRMKDGKLIAVQHYRDASHAIRASKSKKVKPCKRSI